jgi:hypothetical protein
MLLDVNIMTLATYLYVVRMDVEPATESVFNAWYNDEHIPALLQVPGVIAAYRYKSVEGTPKFIAIYELESPTIRMSDAWKQAVAKTPRPQGVTPHNMTRNVYEQIYPK